MNRDLLFENQEALVAQVIEFFFARILKKEHFDNVVAICLKNPEIAKTQRHLFIRNGQFSLRDFFYYWSTLNPKGGVFKNIVVEELLRRLCSYNVLHRSDLLLSFSRKFDYYDVNEPLAKFLWERDAIENLAFDISHLVDKYSQSILHLVVTDKNGDTWNGTGFLFINKVWVITNRHVVDQDANKQPRVLTRSGREQAVKIVRVSSSEDLALIELADPLEARPIFPMLQIDPLEEVLTMGYPRIPLAKAPTLVAHKGEINGGITLAHGDRLLFSAKTAPGNSGGPLLNRAGLAVGVVTEELQTDAALAKNTQPYFAAIPSAHVAKFVQELLSVPASIIPDSPGVALENEPKCPNPPQGFEHQTCNPVLVKVATAAECK